MKRWMILFNPSSRKGASVSGQVRQRIARLGLDVELDWVPIQELKGVDFCPERIVTIGGDGTINAAAQWLLESNLDCPIGIVPAGTGNNLARGLGLSLDLEPALETALGASAIRKIDAVIYQGGPGDGTRRVIVQTGALGYPAQVASRYDELRRGRLFRALCRPAGPHIYRVLALLGLAAQKRRERRGENLLELECRMPGETIKETVFAVFIGNEKSLGGNFYPCPKASLDDGHVDLCLVRAGTGESYLKLFQKIVKGEHLGLEDTIVYRQTKGPVELSLSVPSELLADGDLWLKDSRIRLEVVPRRFQVLSGE